MGAEPSSLSQTWNVSGNLYLAQGEYEAANGDPVLGHKAQIRLDFVKFCVNFEWLLGARSPNRPCDTRRFVHRPLV